MTPRLEIEYCAQCRWLLRAAWMAQELLTTFENGIGEMAGIDPPSDFHVASGADSIFCVRRPAAERIRVVLQKMKRDVKSPSCAPIYAAIPKRFDTNLTCI